MNRIEQPKFDQSKFDKAGLNLHAIFDISTLPNSTYKELQELYPDLSDYNQLILLAHGGRHLWEKIQLNADSTNPVDDYSIKVVNKFFDKDLGNIKFKLIYPSQAPVGLQSLGELAGWHHSSPFRVGINKQWGSWFAYRVAMLADSHFQTTSKVEDDSPCSSCKGRPCISACPAEALESEFSLDKCLSYRKSEDSLCKDRCLARMTCPVAKEHQYELEQIQYHYGISMKMIETLNL